MGQQLDRTDDRVSADPDLLTGPSKCSLQEEALPWQYFSMATTSHLSKWPLYVAIAV